jgi:DNA invertase Pin-like site-specific DNA recombinase
MIYNYVRVSTIDQNTARQLLDVPCDHTYQEKVSGKDQNRPQLTAMLDAIREGDLINVHDLSRLARNTRDLLEIVERIINKGVSIKFHKEGLFFEAGKKEDPYQKLMLTMMAGFAQFERSLILERQREGIAIAKADGKYQGKQSRFTEEKIKLIRERFNDPATNKAALARELKITRAYLYKLVEEKLIASKLD